MFGSILNFFGCKGQAGKEKAVSSNDSANEQILKSFEDYKNRPIHSVLTMEILDSVSDDNLEQTIIDNLYAKLKADTSYEKQYDIIKSLSAGRQAVFATWGLEGEVNNGGFNQYFYNFASSGQYAEEARDGFKLIGANKLADLTQRAIDMVMKNAKHLSKFKDGTLESFSKSYEDNPLNDFDDEFYELDKTENISQLRIKYIKAHKDQFIDK
jgi:hypothetical protein